MYTYKANLIKVVDGDSVWLEVDLGFSTFTKQLIRLEGINTPELSEPLGQEAKKFAQDWFVANPEVSVRTLKREKYGRYLGIVLGNVESLNEALLREGLAVVYNG